MKRATRKRRKEDELNYYNQFIELMNQYDNIDFKTRFRNTGEKLLNKEYKFPVYKKFVNAIIWFEKHYGKNYTLRFTGKLIDLYLLIVDCNNIEFATYNYKNDTITNSVCDTVASMERNFPNGVNPKIHYIID